MLRINDIVELIKDWFPMERGERGVVASVEAGEVNVKFENRYGEYVFSLQEAKEYLRKV